MNGPHEWLDRQYVTVVQLHRQCRRTPTFLRLKVGAEYNDFVYQMHAHACPVFECYDKISYENQQQE